MLPDFISLKRILLRNVEGTMNLNLQGDPLFSEVRNIRVHEGDSFSIHRADGSIQLASFQEHEVKVAISRGDVRATGMRAIANAATEAQDKMREATHRSFYAAIETQVEMAGNQIKGPITAENMLAMMDTLSVDFDEKENPCGISIHCHPNNADSVRNELERLERDPVLKARELQILERKRSEWRDREANRKLVD